MPKHLDTREIVAPSLVIKYNKDNPPSKDTKKKLLEATQLSGKIMRAAVWKMDKVVFFRRDEDWLKAIVNKHFRLGDAGETNADRSKMLNKIRQCMLSTSFHLSTGTYLLDIDGGNRKTMSDGPISAKIQAIMPRVEGYVSTVKSRLIETGPVHISFDLAQRYTARGMARLIIHEATHSFWKTVDVFYSHQAEYDGMTAAQAITNADSYAYAALSIEAQALQTHATLRANGDH